MSKRRYLTDILLIILLSSGIYANSLKNDFVYDDNTILGGLRHAGDLSKLLTLDYFRISGETTYRPIVTFSYYLDYVLFEFSPWGYHLTNLLIHTGNALLLYLFLMQTVCSHKSHDSLFELTGAVLFATHPILAEAVNGISFREDLLAFLFSFSALNLYIFARSDDGSFTKHVQYLSACLLYMLASLSKEMAITLPLLLIVFELFSDGRIYLKQIKRLSGFIVAGIVYLIIRFYFMSNPWEKGFLFRKWTLIERFLTLPGTISSYLQMIIMPVSLSADYPVQPISTIFTDGFILPLIVILLIGLAMYRLAAQGKSGTNKVVAFGISFFLITLLPVSNLVQIFNPMAERYMYLPMAGICITAAASACAALRLKRYNRLFKLLLVFIIISYAAITVNRNGVWKDDYSLWANTVQTVPGSSKAHYGLGNAYKNKGMIDKAIQEYRSAVKLDPDNIDSHSNLGDCYITKGLLNEAQTEFEEVLRISPGDYFTLQNLGGIYMDKGLFPQALKVYQKIAYMAPGDRFAKKMIDEIPKKIELNQKALPN